MKYKLLIIGPFPKPYLGVSIANETLYNDLVKYNNSVDKINTEFNKAISNDWGKFSINKLSFAFSYFQIYKIIKSDVVYITPGQSFFGVLKYFPYTLISKIFRKKLVFHLHGNDLLNQIKKNSGIKKTIFKFLIKQYDIGIVLSNSLKKNLIPFIDEKNIFIVPNFIQKELIEHQPNKNYKTLRLFYLSNLIVEKGILVLLNAVEELKLDGIEIEIKLAGQIDDAFIEDKIKKLDIEYVGMVKGLEKAKLLEWGNVFCLPTTLNEGQPISIIESMKTGSLILTTPLGGITDICDDTNTLFIIPNDVQDLKNKILQLYKNIEVVEKIGKHNLSTYKTSFLQENFVLEIKKIITHSQTL